MTKVSENNSNLLGMGPFGRLVKQLISSVALVMLGITGLSATWYVDGSATGANNGTNWVNAWRTLGDVNWDVIQPGDTIYLSGGTTGQTYSSSLNIRKSGTSNAPITIRVSQEAGHNGLVTIYTGTSDIAVRMQDWITLNGAKDDKYADKWITNTLNVPLITNNINLRLIGQQGINYTGPGPQGMRVLWVEFQSPADVVGYNGIRINASSPAVAFSNEVAWCWFHNIAQDGVSHISDNKNHHWDCFVMHHCLVEDVGDDGLEIGTGWTVHHSILRNTLQLHGHPDGVQFTGRYLRLYNNILYDWASSHIRLQGKDAHYGPIQIYGNLFYTEDKYVSATQLEIVWFAASDRWRTNLAVWGDWVIANNTFAYPFNGCLSISKRDGFPTNCYLTNILIANNIFYCVTNWAVSIHWGPTSEGGGYWWNEPDVVFDYNVVHSISGRYPTLIHYHETNYNTAEAMSVAGIYKFNTGSAPQFIDLKNFNFGLNTNDTVARATGTNLTGLDLPGLSVDLRGKPRGLNGLWDRGALAGVQAHTPHGFVQSENLVFVDTNLLVWLSFEDDWQDRPYVADHSGYGNHAWRFGRPEAPTNYPTRVLASISPGCRLNMGWCADFRWFWDGWGLYGRSGQYLAITNTARLTNMPRATIALWARYYNAKRVHPANTITADHNARLLSAGTSWGTIGSWGLGREYSSYTQFYVVTNSSNKGIYFTRVIFPDTTWNDDGDSKQWNHYAITFDNGLIKAYFNGELFASVTSSATSLVIHNYDGNTHPWYSNSTKWIGVGCDTHCGTPPMEDELFEDYPNHGWLNGLMDEVMIFDRVLSPEEIQAVYLGQLLRTSRPAPPRNLGIK